MKEAGTIHRAAFQLALGLLLSMAVLSCAAAPAVRKVNYTIQAGAFSRLENAERLNRELQKKGLDSYYFKNENGLYTVRFGNYQTREIAEEQARRLLAQGTITSYFIAAPHSYAPKAKGWQKERSLEKSISPDNDLGYVAARTAERFIGIPYRWGGNTVVDGLDCSGFTRAVYHLIGVSIPRTAAEQYKAGRKVNRTGIKDGDLVFFSTSKNRITHVGVYVGDGRFVHAPKRGEDIRISSIKDGFSSSFVGARRYY